MQTPKSINAQNAPNQIASSHSPAKRKTLQSALTRAVLRPSNFWDMFHFATVQATRFSCQPCLLALQLWTQLCYSSLRILTVHNPKQLNIWLPCKLWSLITLSFFKTKSILFSKTQKEPEKTTSKSNSSRKIPDGKILQLFPSRLSKDITSMLYANRSATFPFPKETLLFPPKWSLFVVLMSTSLELQSTTFKEVLSEVRSSKESSKSEWMSKSDLDTFTRILMAKSDADPLRVKLLHLKLNKIISFMLFPVDLLLQAWWLIPVWPEMIEWLETFLESKANFLKFSLKSVFNSQWWRSFWVWVHKVEKRSK